MTTKKKAPPKKITKEMIPSLDGYYTPADPVLGGRDEFRPYKFSLSKVGRGAAVTLEHTVNPEIVLQKEAYVIFLAFPRNTMRFLKDGANPTGNRLAMTFDGKWSPKGYPWSKVLELERAKAEAMGRAKDEMPKQSLVKNSYFLVWDPDREVFVLANFFGSIDKTDVLLNISKKMYAIGRKQDGIGSVAQAIIKLGTGTEKSNNGNSYPVVDPEKCEYISAFSESVFDLSKDLSGKIRDIEEKKVTEVRKRAKHLWETERKDELEQELSLIQTSQDEEEQEDQKKQDPNDDSSDAPSDKSKDSANPSEDVGDDELPF